MNLKDKIFLKRFRVKESRLGSKILGPQSFPLWAGWDGIPPINEKMTKYLPKTIQLESEGSRICRA